MKGVLNRKLLVTLIAVLVVALSCALFVSCKANVYLVSAEYDAGRGQNLSRTLKLCYLT